MNTLIIIAVVRHRVLGYILVPYLSVQQSPHILAVQGHATPITIERMTDVPDDVRKLVDILDSLSDQRIANAFSRGKTPKAFIESLNIETLQKQVRPYIDKKIAQALPLIISSRIHVFLKHDGYQTINVSDALDVAPLNSCRPKFFFTLADSGDLLYTLKISDGATDISLFHQEMIELSANPAIFVSGKSIYSFADAPFSRFKPFAANQRIKVEARIVDSYMRKFVLGSVKNFHVNAYGFDIHRHKSQPTVEMRAKSSVFGWGFELAFLYADDVCLYGVPGNPATVNINADGRYVFDVTVRNRPEEARVSAFLIDDMGLSLMSSLLVFPDRKSELQDLVRWSYVHKEELLEHGITVVMSDEANRYFFGHWELSTQVDDANDWFDLKMIVMIGDYKIPFASLFKNISSGNNQFILPNGEIFLIPDEWFEQWSGVVPFLVPSADGSLRVNKRYAQLLPSFMRSSQDDDLAEASAVSVVPVTLPGVEMRPYQQVGVDWLRSLAVHGRGGILADDMGLGKTLQTIALLSSLYADNATQPVLPLFQGNTTGKSPSLIVMPVSLIANWQRELHRFAPHLAVYTYIGRHAVVSSTLPQTLAQYHVVLTSYGHVRLYSDALSAIKFECIVLDESHTVKNSSSQTYRAIASLKASVHFNLSGTPVENNLTDLWAQMNLVNPGLLGSRDYFEHRYRQPIETRSDNEKLRLLKTIIRPYLLRRTKEQVLRDLPPISIQTIECAMTDHQAEVYEREKSACRNLLLDASQTEARKKFMVLQALTRLRLLANHPALCIPDYDGGSGKFDTVMGYISSIIMSGHKLLLFSSFVRDMEMLALRLDEAHIPHTSLTGKTQNRDQVVQAFESTSTPTVMLISLKAGGVGLNLVSADYVVILNPWWNPAAEQQAYGRAHRIGQTRPVTVYRFISSDTIEQKINQMQERKLKLASDAVETDSMTNIATPFTDDELASFISE